jgi:hypothetical protein
MYTNEALALLCQIRNNVKTLKPGNTLQVYKQECLMQHKLYFTTKNVESKVHLLTSQYL